MVLLTAQDLHRGFGLKKVLDGVSFAIDEGERVGLVGLNGSGKTTLGRLVAGVDVPDAGTLTLRRGATLGYFEQVPRLPPDRTARQVVLDGLRRWSEAKQRYDAVAERLASGPANPDALLAEQATLAETIGLLGGWEMDHEADAVLGHLGIDVPDAVVGSMSGGEQRRVALARLLVSRPDLAVLDEPTNHLDVETIEWLERHLAERHSGAVLLITHDRWLLDRVAHRTFELDRGALHAYDGGYEDYLEAKAEREATAQRTEANRQNFLRRELQWLRRQPKARSTKQKARIDRAQAAMQSEAPQRERTVALQTSATRTGKTILDIVDLRLEIGDRTLVDGFTLGLGKGDRVGIVGRNGAGKTTLLRSILGSFTPSHGEIRLGKNTAIAYLDQTRSGLDDDATVYDAVANGRSRIEIGDRAIEIRVWLEQFLFDSATARKQVGVLSGGERARVALARMLGDPSNLLVLDEPTNDLDVPTLGALEEMLVEYGGTCLVVTHDRYFLDRVATAIVAFEADGNVVRYEGNYSRYRSLQQAQREAALEPAPTAASKVAKAKPSKPGRGLTYAERLELDGLEGKIEAADATVAELQQRLADPQTYAAGPDVARTAAAELERAKADVERLMQRWEELEHKREGGSA